MSTTSRTNEELLTPGKGLTRNQKKQTRGLIINNNIDRGQVWNESNSTTMRKVPVLYYLSHNGHLEHPHLIDVPLSSPHGLYLRDVMNTLNCHRGKGTANMYSWSYKRGYKNGYVWHDATEHDLIQPLNDRDYVLKGSELVQTSKNQLETNHTCSIVTSTTEPEATVVRRNQSWSSFDNPHEYLVAKCESNRELTLKFAPDVGTQTEDKRLPLNSEVSDVPASPPSNSSSSEVLEAVNGSRGDDDEHGRMKLSRILMQLITCGADSFRNVKPIIS